jgi:hypothetical protein
MTELDELRPILSDILAVSIGETERRVTRRGIAIRPALITEVQTGSTVVVAFDEAPTMPVAVQWVLPDPPQAADRVMVLATGTGAVFGIGYATPPSLRQRTAWQTTMQAGGAPVAVGAGGALSASWSRAADVVSFEIVGRFGANPTIPAGEFTWTAPVAPQQRIVPAAVGAGMVRDGTSAPLFRVCSFAAGSALLQLVTEAGTPVGAATPFTFAEGSTFHAAGSYFGVRL